MNKYQQVGIRLAISTGVGILVAALATVVAWRDIARMGYVRPEQRVTREAIFEVKELIQGYRGSSGPLPRSLEELHGGPDSLQRDEKGRPLDGWGRPFLYSTDGTKYTITSLGQDGKPGGFGLDFDLSNTNDWPDEARPTFRQFLTHPMTRGSALACLACGLLAFLVSFLTVHPSMLHGWAILILIAQLTLTILGAIFVAFLMSFAEIPNYH